MVHEDSGTTAHLVLPSSDKLTEAELGAWPGAVGLFPSITLIPVNGEDEKGKEKHHDDRN